MEKRELSSKPTMQTAARSIDFTESNPMILFPLSQPKNMTLSEGKGLLTEKQSIPTLSENSFAYLAVEPVLDE